MSNPRRRKTYDKEFKREAVHLVIEEDRKASEVERNLGISKSRVKSVDKFLITEEYPDKPEVKDNEFVKNRKKPFFVIV